MAENSVWSCRSIACSKIEEKMFVVCDRLKLLLHRFYNEFKDRIRKILTMIAEIVYKNYFFNKMIRTSVQNAKNKRQVVTFV